LGQELGADVPFFLGGRNAWVQGIGEQLQDLQAFSADEFAQALIS
jgi:4-diphosphocytidyl-2-C-methyl-D-erythritol kinase